MGKVSFLHTNDLHGAMSPDLAMRLAELRQECDLSFDSGDCIKTGNLGIPLGPDPVWELLECDASVLGNRETHPIAKIQTLKTQGAAHPILVANMWNLDGSAYADRSLVYSDINGLRVGVFGVMVPMCTDQKPDKALWSHRWTQPIPEAIKLAQALRPECDLLIALTHIGFSRDVELARSAPEIDIIFGGHSHTVLHEPHREGRTSICQGGSHGRFAGVYHWASGRLDGGLHPLKDPQ